MDEAALIRHAIRCRCDRAPAFLFGERSQFPAIPLGTLKLANVFLFYPIIASNEISAAMMDGTSGVALTTESIRVGPSNLRMIARDHSQAGGLTYVSFTHRTSRRYEGISKMWSD